MEICNNVDSKYTLYIIYTERRLDLVNIILIRRLQTDLEWKHDCHEISKCVFLKSNLHPPHVEYKKYFIESLSDLIENTSYIEDTFDSDLEYILKKISSYGADCAYSKANIDYSKEFQLIISKEYIDFIKNLIVKTIKSYYTNTNKKVPLKLKHLESKALKTYSIIPSKFYKGIIYSSLNFNSKVFQSSYNNDEDCIKEFTDTHTNKESINLLNFIK